MARHGQYAWLRGMAVNVVLGAIAEQTPALFFEAADDLGSIRLDTAHRIATTLRLYRRTPTLLQARRRDKFEPKRSAMVAAEPPLHGPSCGNDRPSPPRSCLS